MKRLVNILVCIVLASSAMAQEDTHVVDSLLNVLSMQEGREKVKTMLELTWDFYDVSFDDCIKWGEKAIAEAQSLNEFDLEAEANYTLGVQYAQHSDLDLAKHYLYLAYSQYLQIDDSDYVREFGWVFSSTKFAFLSLWNIAAYELTIGNIDTSYVVFQKALPLAERMEDTLACAQVHGNLAIAYYQLNDFKRSITELSTSRKYYESLNDSAALVQTDFHLATLYGEVGKTDEARRLYHSVIPKLEAYGMYDVLLVAYKNYGILFERDFVNYDSAQYFFNKALAVTELEDISRRERQTMANSKADVLVELGNVAVGQSDLEQAMAYFDEALQLAKTNNYHFGQMQAMLGLGQLYAKQGKAAQSLQYLERYADEADRSGITMMEHVVRKSLILDYARLGRFAEMEKKLDELDEQRAALSRENADLYEQNTVLGEELQGLLQQYDTQNAQIEILQTQRNHYRLAFFGLLALVLFVVVLFFAYKIVRKKRAKSVNP